MTLNGGAHLKTKGSNPGLKWENRFGPAGRTRGTRLGRSPFLNPANKEPAGCKCALKKGSKAHSAICFVILVLILSTSFPSTEVRLMSV